MVPKSLPNSAAARYTWLQGGYAKSFLKLIFCFKAFWLGGGHIFVFKWRRCDGRRSRGLREQHESSEGNEYSYGTLTRATSCSPIFSWWNSRSGEKSARLIVGSHRWSTTRSRPRPIQNDFEQGEEGGLKSRDDLCLWRFFGDYVAFSFLT